MADLSVLSEQEDPRPKIITRGNVIQMMISARFQSCVVDDVKDYIHLGWKITSEALHQLEIHFLDRAEEIKQLAESAISSSP